MIKKILLMLPFLASAQLLYAQEYSCPTAIECSKAGDVSSCQIIGGSPLFSDPKTLTVQDNAEYPVIAGKTYMFNEADIENVYMKDTDPTSYLCFYSVPEANSVLYTHANKAGLYSPSNKSVWALPGEFAQCVNFSPEQCLFADGPFKPSI